MGSSPIARSGLLRNDFHPGDVAKWQGKGLQNPHQGFKSPRRLSNERAYQGSFFFTRPSVTLYGGKKARVCKTLIRGSNPLVASQLSEPDKARFIFTNIPSNIEKQRELSDDLTVPFVFVFMDDIF